MHGARWDIPSHSDSLQSSLPVFGSSGSRWGCPTAHSPLEKKLYSTYLTYLPEEHFSYPLKANTDERGSFTEFIRTPDRGQFSVNVTKPGVTKGNHWHHTKTEKFLVVSGNALIQLRKTDSDRIAEYIVSGEQPQVVDIPPGYTHNIKNIGETDLCDVDVGK